MERTVFWKHRVVRRHLDVSEEQIASIFRVEEQAKQENNEPQLADCFCLLRCSFFDPED
jgi:hypothetical protein